MKRGDAWAIVIGLLASLPFWAKPFHIDDILYLRVAQQITKTPFSPYEGMVLWDAKDGQPAKLFTIDFNPPLEVHCRGWIARGRTIRDWPAYDLCLLHRVGHTGTLSLGEPIMSARLWVTAISILGPVYIVGQNLMLEPALLCFSVWGAERLLASLTTPKDQRLIWLAGLLFSCAVLTKYTAGILLVMPILLCLLTGRLRYLQALILPIFAVALWFVHNRIYYASGHLDSHVSSIWSESSINVFLGRTFSTLRILGGVTFLSLPIAVILFRRSIALPLVFLIGSAVLAWLQFGWLVRHHEMGDHWAPRPLQIVHYVGFSANGTFIALGWLWLALPNFVRHLLSAPFFTGGRRPAVDSEQSLSAGTSMTIGSLGFPLITVLDGWILVGILFNIGAVPFSAVRHMLLVIIPMTISIIAHAQRLSKTPQTSDLENRNDDATLNQANVAGNVVPGPETSARVPLGRTSLVLTIALGIILALADYEIAQLYQTTARTMVANRVKQLTPIGKTVWYTGNWGFVYYANQAGGFPLVKNPEQFGMPIVQAGDMMVSPQLITWESKHPLPKGLIEKYIEHKQPLTWNCFRTIAPFTNHYSVRDSSLPWQFLLFDPSKQEKGTLFEFPPLEDILVAEIVEARR